MDAKEREQLISEIQISLAKKKQCLSLAVKTVERLLDDPVSRQELLECCFHINQSYLKDVMEERGILMKCGYPICLNKLEKIIRQKYHISTKYNKVFDLAERKYFCSNICYKSFKYLESQLPTCPLWLLDKEGPKDIRLFSVDSVETAEASPLPKRSEEEATLCPEPTAIKEETRVAADEIDTETGDISVDELSKGVKNVSLSSRKVQKIRKTVSTVGSLSVVVEKVLKEWITPKTLQLLFTAEQYAELLQTKSVTNESSADDALNDSTNADEDLNQKYNVLSDIDSDLTSFELDSDSVARKAMPSYDQLIVDTREICASVQAFYKGQSRQVVDSTIDGKTVFEKKQPVDKVENVKFYAPLVDSQSQNALRTRIVLEKLNGASVEILEMLKIPLSVITNEFRQLVHTFRLQARNITFKPREWFLLALLLINMISIKDKFVRDALTTESSLKILQNVLENFKLDAAYLETTCRKLLDSVIEEIELD